MIQLQYVDKSFLVSYKDGLMTFHTSNYLSLFAEYEHKKNKLKDNI